MAEQVCDVDMISDEMPISKFKQMLFRKYNIDIKEITSQKIILQAPLIEGQDYTGYRLSNSYDSNFIYSSFKCQTQYDPQEYTLEEALVTSNKIKAIKLLRNIFDYSLKQAKNCADINWEEWLFEINKKRIDGTPFKNLPLLINDIKNEKAYRYLLDRIKSGDTITQGA